MPNLLYPELNTMPTNMRFYDAGRGTQQEVIRRLGPDPGLENGAGMCCVFSIKWACCVLDRAVGARNLQPLMTAADAPVRVLGAFERLATTDWTVNQNIGEVFYRNMGADTYLYKENALCQNNDAFIYQMAGIVDKVSQQRHAVMDSRTIFSSDVSGACGALRDYYGSGGEKAGLLFEYSKSGAHAMAWHFYQDCFSLYDCNQGVFVLNVGRDSHPEELDKMISRIWQWDKVVGSRIVLIQ